jgi:thiamine transport system ATP-binding protein
MAVMREGRLVQHGTLDEVWSRPADAWTARFLGYAAVVDGVALRRSALRVTDDGPLHGTVLEARVTPEQVRLELEVEGMGRLPGVADRGHDVRVGAEVRLTLDRSRTAVLR